MFEKMKVPKELSEKALEALEKARSSGKIKKGTNETTKIIERGHAALVVIAMDVEPPEVIAHIPILCQEKDVPCILVESKIELGAAAGIEVSASAVCVVNPGEAKPLIDEIVRKLSAASEKEAEDTSAPSGKAKA